MKTQILLLACYSLLALAGCIKDENHQPQKQAILIPNGDFETWTNLRELAIWTTNSCYACANPLESYLVQIDSLPNSGLYDARFITSQVSPGMADNKFALSAHPATLNAFVRCNMPVADTVRIKITLYLNLAAVDSGEWLGIASTPGFNFTQISIPISQNAIFSDSALVHIEAGSLPFSTAFCVDDITLQ